MVYAKCPKTLPLLPGVSKIARRHIQPLKTLKVTMTSIFPKPFTGFLKTASVIIAATALFVCESKAQTSSYSVEATQASAPTEWNSNFDLAKFDSSLGTLQSVEITLSSGATTTITVSNNAASSSSGNVRTDLLLTLTSSNVDLAPGGLALEFLVPAAKQNYSLAAGESKQFANLSASSEQSFLFDGDVSQFVGPGPIHLNLTTETATTQTNTGGNTDSSQSTNASGNVKVTYNYTPAAPVPEPATWAALAMGAGLLIISARFRRRTV